MSVFFFSSQHHSFLDAPVWLLLHISQPRQRSAVAAAASAASAAAIDPYNIKIKLQYSLIIMNIYITPYNLLNYAGIRGKRYCADEDEDDADVLVSV